MPTLYFSDGTKDVREVEDGIIREKGAVWLDVLRPTDEELDLLGKQMGFPLPDRHDMTEIELSSRLYKTGDTYVMIANLLPKSVTEVLPPRPAAFIMRQNLLVTVRYSDFFSFDRMGETFRRMGERRTPQTVFCSLLDEGVSDRADNLEFLMRRLEELTSSLFLTSPEHPSTTNAELEASLKIIAGMGERVSNIRESIASLQRALNYARTYLPPEWMASQKVVMNSLNSDLTALSDEASFFVNKLNFNLDATLGMINIEETKIIRVLSIVTLLLSPPTLIAGIYGMNFRLMPELEWPFGYVFSIALMAGSTFLSLWYLRRKKWL